MASDLFYSLEINCIALSSYFSFESLLHKKEGRRTDKDLATNNCQKLSTHVENNYFVLKFVINTMPYIL